ncbi:hypothetical protein O181_034414 [Austropuccinia psidii MF-1]|uniref:Uncharacterized protein n=1 Tax=Austropuccinia psidii MF-1 TaxID=1389203 RepID=A0A9Q3D0N8_9BASI|nr:hypothetical protein [Austropuccinia psidii MF-1]
MYGIQCTKSCALYCTVYFANGKREHSFSSSVDFLEPCKASLEFPWVSDRRVALWCRILAHLGRVVSRYSCQTASGWAKKRAHKQNQNLSVSFIRFLQTKTPIRWSMII